MRVSIIGSNSFLAKYIGKYCNENDYEVYSFGRSISNYYFSEYHELNLLINDINYSILEDSDVIFYTAGAGIQSNLNQTWIENYTLNTFVPISITNELSHRKYKGIFVSFGSYFEIGNNSQSKIYDEIELVNSILKVPNDYCVSKRLLTKYRNSFDSSFKYYHFILPTIYGELELKHRLIPYTVNTIRNGGKLMFSSGKQIRQYLYAGDIPKLIFEIFYKCEDGIYNIAGSETLSVRGIVETICLKYGVQLDSEMFGVEKRQDVFMLNLQLSGLKLHQKNGEFNFSKIVDILDKY